MDRRHFVKAGLAAGALGTTRLAAEDTPTAERGLFELRIYELRSDLDPARTREFFGQHFIPALQRQGVGPVGAFVPETGFARESLVLLIPYASPAEMLQVQDRLAADRRYLDALGTFEGASLPYVRYESRLARGFARYPVVERLPAAAAPRLFEMRVYESRNAHTLERKIDMFNQGEVEIFRKSGMAPVFFGENLYAPRLPSLSYMVAFDDMAARQRAWDTFRAHPEWKQMQADPRWQVEGAVSSSQIALMAPTPFSQIR